MNDIKNITEKKIFVGTVSSIVNKTFKDSNSNNLEEKIDKIAKILEETSYIELTDKKHNKKLEKREEEYRKTDLLGKAIIKVAEKISTPIIETFKTTTKGKILFKSDFNEMLKSIFEENDNVDYKNNDIKILKMPKEETKNVAKELIDLMNNNSFSDEEMKEATKDILNKKYDSYNAININGNLFEKTNKFTDCLKTIENAVKNLDFEDEGIKFKINISNKREDERYSLEYFDKNEKIKVKSNTLADFKETLIETLEKNFRKKTSNSKELQNKHYKEFNEGIENIRNINLTEMLAHTDKDFELKYSNEKENKFIGKYPYTLKIRDNEGTHILHKSLNENINELVANVVDKSYSETLNLKEDKFKSVFLSNIDYIKEKNDELIKKTDNFIGKTEKKDLETFNNEIIFNTLLSTLKSSKDYNVLETLKNNFNSNYKEKIKNLTDKKEFIEEYHKEFDLSLNPEGKISELYNGNDNDYENRIDEILENHKDSLLDNFLDEFENIREKEMTDNIALEQMKEKYGDIGNLKDIQQLIETTIPILYENEKLSGKEIMEKLNEEKENGILYKKFNNYLGKNSENLKGKIDEGLLKNICEHTNLENIDAFYEKNADFFEKKELKEIVVEKRETTKVFDFSNLNNNSKDEIKEDVIEEDDINKNLNNKFSDDEFPF